MLENTVNKLNYTNVKSYKNHDQNMHFLMCTNNQLCFTLHVTTTCYIITSLYDETE